MMLTRTVKAAAALGMLSSAVWTSTYAAFSDEADAVTGTFTAGTLDLQVADVAEGTTESYGFTSLTMSAMKPGDAVVAPLAISNPGSLGATYGMTTPTVGGTGLPVLVSVKAGATSCTLASFAGGTDLLVGVAPASASFTGRTLAATSGTETLCFRVELPSTAENAAQGRTASMTFRFAATVTP